MLSSVKWIKPANDYGFSPIYIKNFTLVGEVKNATLSITAVGVYEATLNGARVGSFVMAPGYTSYWNRLQYQTYDITEMLCGENDLRVLVCPGWWRSRYTVRPLRDRPAALIAAIDIEYTDGRCERITTDTTWKTKDSSVKFSDIFDGEFLDATHRVADTDAEDALFYDGPGVALIPQEGEEVREQERIAAQGIFTTLKGEVVVDFGQNITGYVEIVAQAKEGERISVVHSEVMDADGNFYNENYRSAAAKYEVICAEGRRVYKPKGTFYGFRYIKLEEYPDGAENAKAEDFTAIAVYSDIKQTIKFDCSDALLNRFYNNVIWGQKDNFLDIPTDCPQRDERRGWSGDAQVFVKAACYNFDVEKFFIKWLRDMHIEQRQGGIVDWIIPTCDNLYEDKASATAGWGDVATVAPWTVYMSYGNEKLLAEHFDMMKGWVDYITGATEDPYLWTGAAKKCQQFGDWLGLDAPEGSYKGSSRDDFIASAYYAYSTSLVIKAGKVLKKDISAYEELYKNIVAKFRATFTEYTTQTECVLAIQFDLAEDIKATADLLAQKIVDCGRHLQTGFLGTAYLLHALHKGGYSDLAWELLLRREFPSWLYAPLHGGTTVWEHWDSVKEDGSFWSSDMNSLNHYAYGAVMDWVYGVAAGITPEEAGYKRIRIAPIPSERLEWLNVEYESRAGLIKSGWRRQDKFWRYEIETPAETIITIDGREYKVGAGRYVYFSEIKRRNKNEY